MKRAILEANGVSMGANGVSMAMIILSDIKLFWGLIYIISGLSNHFICHRHKKINTKL